MVAKGLNIEELPEDNRKAIKEALSLQEIFLAKEIEKFNTIMADMDNFMYINTFLKFYATEIEAFMNSIFIPFIGKEIEDE